MAQLGKYKEGRKEARKEGRKEASKKKKNDFSYLAKRIGQSWSSLFLSPKCGEEPPHSQKERGLATPGSHLNGFWAERERERERERRKGAKWMFSSLMCKIK